MKSIRTKPNPCPHCGRILDAATSRDNEAPEPYEGAISICFYCREWSVFQADGTLQKPTDEKIKEVHDNPDLWIYLERAKII